jgi:hypothetical protein
MWSPTIIIPLTNSPVSFNFPDPHHLIISDNDPILGNYACLQLFTTRNMRPGLFIDWLWGGLNYQIEHHLFPTMPRHNLEKVMPMVKAFCAENNLPYMVRFLGRNYKFNSINIFYYSSRLMITLLAFGLPSTN